MSPTTSTSVNGRHGNYTVAGSYFADGGEAQLYRCTSDSTLVFKKYKRPLTDATEIANVEGLVTIGREILKASALAPGTTPESSVCWPLDIVRAGTSSNNIAGIVLPTIPAKFFNANGDPRGLEFLILARANPPAAATRVAVLLRLAEILSWLASRSLVHGDISAKNVVWSGGGSGNAFLIDTDGLRPSTQTPLGGVATPGWTDPRLVERKISTHDKYSDWYALALAMYRGLFLNPGSLDRRPDGTWPAPSAIPSGVSPPLRRCIEQTLGNPLDPLKRTTPAEWVRTLLGTFVSNGAYNAQTLRVLDDHAAQHRTRYQRPAQPTPRVAQTTTRTTGPSPRPPTPMPGAPNRRWGQALLVGLLMLILIVAVVFIGGGDDDSSRTVGGSAVTSATEAATGPGPAEIGSILPAQLVGRWEGPVDQPGSGTYGVVMILRDGRAGEVVGSTSYPSLECGGTLTLSAGGPETRVLEDITEGTSRCINVSIR